MVRRCIKKSETVCRRNRVKIIKFAQAHRNWSVDDWKRVIFSVESYFVIGGENRTMIWRGDMTKNTTDTSTKQRILNKLYA